MLALEGPLWAWFLVVGFAGFGIGLGLVLGAYVTRILRTIAGPDPEE